MPPIQVYLDSSDYSVLSDPKKAADAEVQDTLAYLRDATRSGLIEVRHSIIHITEACHRDASSKPLAAARARLIAELSGSKVMCHFTDIVAGEVVAALRAVRSGSAALDDSGRWFPRMPKLGREIRQAVEEGMQEGASSVGYNRKSRRTAQSLLGSRERPGRARKDSFADRHALSALCERYGMSERFVRERLLARLADARTSDADLAALVEQELFEPERFIAHYLDRLEKDRRVRDAVRSLGQRMIDGVENLRAALNRLQQATPAATVMPIAEARAHVRRALTGFRRAMVEAAVRAHSGDVDVDEVFAQYAEFPRDRFPGVDALALFVEDWLLATGGGAKHSREPLRSDAGDLLHAFYVPYVDVWRGDRHTSNVARPIAARHGTVVAASLRDLRSSIDRARGRLRQAQ